MSGIITVRDSDIIASEINTIKEDTRRVMIASSIRIGGKLLEAKAMVPFGEWGKWLEEKVDYSQSTANNLMKLYQEYRDQQESLFDNWTKSETFANLSYTQHMALLALPFAERAEFAESHEVESMSTRELEKAVREELEKAKRELADSVQQKETLRQKLDAAEHSGGELSRELEQARQKAKEAGELVVKVTETAAELKKKLEEAEARERKAREELKTAKEKPEISPDLMAQLRAEAEQEAARTAVAEVSGKLEAALKRAEAAEKEKQAAEKALETAEKKQQMADGDVSAYNALMKQLQETYNVLDGYRLKVAGKDPDTGEKLRRFQELQLRKWMEGLA